MLVLAAALLWLLTANLPFLEALLAHSSARGTAAVVLAVALGAGVWAVHVLLLGLLAHRTTIKPLLALLTLVAAVAGWFSSRYGVVLDPAMLRNALHTDFAEARELIGWPLAQHVLLFGALPIAVLTRVQLTPRRSLRSAVGARAGLLGLAAVVLVGAVLAAYPTLSAGLRVNKALRYQITPVNVLWSTGAALAGDLRGAARPRVPIGLDARLGPSHTGRSKPLVLVLVLGETARAANWGLAGYPRDTTPQLRHWPVIDFGAVQSCGTHTEASVPCLFAPVGRRNYDESRIRGQDSLLHLLARAGVNVHWRDNQSGCKGVCDGLPGDRPSPATAGALCEGDRCLDEALVHDLDQRLARLHGQPGAHVWVLHMLGNHGPAYFRRHPESATPFTPECREEELSRCTRDSVVNAYDNALRYTDAVLAQALQKLQSHASEVDTALLYVSDHGESLGELGLYLHGLPYAMAPSVQKQVPMIFWASEGFEPGAGLPPGCMAEALRARARAGDVRHDHLFHTVLGLLDVGTALHEPSWDLVAPCRARALALWNRP